MGTVAYLGTVVAVCGLALGAMYVVVGLLGRRIDDLRGDVNERFGDVERVMTARFDAVDVRFDAVDARFGAVDARFDAVDTRLDDVDARFTGVDGRFVGIEDRLARLEAQNDTILGAVTDLGQRVTRLESRPAS